MYYSTVYSSPIGLLTLASNGEQIAGLWVEGQKYFGSRLGELRQRNDLPVFTRPGSGSTATLPANTLRFPWFRWRPRAASFAARTGKSCARFPMAKPPPMAR